MLGTLFLSLLFCLPAQDSAQPAQKVKVLFLGDKGHHQPAMRFRQLAAAWANQPIVLEYTEDLKVLNGKTLEKYDALMIYANHPKIEPDQEKALLEYVRSGKGFLPCTVPRIVSSILPSTSSWSVPSSNAMAQAPFGPTLKIPCTPYWMAFPGLRVGMKLMFTPNTT